MSRRLNRDPLPLHKPEACSNLQQWLDLARGCYLHSWLRQFRWWSFLWNVRWDGLWPTWPHLLLWQWEGFFSPVVVLPILQLLNALAKARPFDLGSLCVGSVVLWPVSPGSWPGGAWVPWRALPWFCGGFCCFWWSCISSCNFVSLFHLQNGLRPNSWRWLVLSFSLSMIDQVAWTTRQLRGKKIQLLNMKGRRAMEDDGEIRSLWLKAVSAQTQLCSVRVLE